ncbi:MAG: hypothetical protein V3V00_15560 [Saprospiraceae bacterium]
MASSFTSQQDRTISDLYDLRFEVEEAFINKDSYLAREQVIRFENIYRYFAQKLSLNGRYSSALDELKLMVFRQIDYPMVQRKLLEEVRRFILDIHYLEVV